MEKDGALAGVVLKGGRWMRKPVYRNISAGGKEVNRFTSDKIGTRTRQSAFRSMSGSQSGVCPMISQTSCREASCGASMITSSWLCRRTLAFFPFPARGLSAASPAVAGPGSSWRRRCVWFGRMSYRRQNVWFSYGCRSK